MAKRWGNRPPGSNWGEFGDDDQHERMNYITAERKPPLFHPVYRGDRVYFNFASSEIAPHFNDVGSDEANMLYMQYSTHRDSFEHKGTVFDADGDGDGVEEKASHNGWRRVDDEEKGLNNALGALSVC